MHGWGGWAHAVAYGVGTAGGGSGGCYNRRWRWRRWKVGGCADGDGTEAGCCYGCWSRGAPWGPIAGLGGRLGRSDWQCGTAEAAHRCTSSPAG